MFEEVSPWVLPFQAGFSECQGRFPEPSSISHGLIWNLNVLSQVLCYNGGREPQKAKHPPTFSLQHRCLKHLALNYKMTTVHKILNLFLLKKETTHCLVPSHGLCLASCVWRSQESLAEEGRSVWVYYLLAQLPKHHGPCQWPQYWRASQKWTWKRKET